jgi:hypothetical protein
MLPVALGDLAIGLARGLDEQRHPQDLVDVAEGGLAAAELAGLEAHAVVGRDQEQGVVVHALLLEPPHDLAISRSVSPACIRWRWRESWGGQASEVQPLALRPSPRSVY